MLWQVDRYVYLTDAQKSLVNERLTELMSWHRSNELPVYVKFLNEADDRLQAGEVDEKLVKQWRTAILARWPVMVEKITPGLSELAMSLSPEQIARAKRKVSEDNTKLRKDYLLEGAARTKARIERYENRAEFFLGSLDEAQTAYIREISAKLPATEPVWYAERETRQRALFSLLEGFQAQKPSTEQAQASVKTYLLGMWQAKDASRAVKLDAAATQSDQISAELLRLASASQKSVMSKKLRGYADDFAKLAGR